MVELARSKSRCNHSSLRQKAFRRRESHMNWVRLHPSRRPRYIYILWCVAWIYCCIYWIAQAVFWLESFVFRPACCSSLSWQACNTTSGCEGPCLLYLFSVVCPLSFRCIQNCTSDSVCWNQGHSASRIWLTRWYRQAFNLVTGWPWLRPTRTSQLLYPAHSISNRFSSSDHWLLVS